jgi:2'-5' RNA ligase
MPDSFRGFVALPLPTAVREGAAGIVERLRCDDLRWTATENFHLTLKFLGEVPPARLTALTVALGRAAAEAAPFDFALRGLGAFPRPERPQVIWIGVAEGETAMAALAARVEAACAAVGFPAEERPFRAHLTLGRTRGDRGAPPPRGLTERLRAMGAVDLGFVRADHFNLMQSDLSPRGPIYRVVETYSFGGTVGEGAPVG